MFDKEKAEFANTWTHAVALLLFCLMAIPLLMGAFSHGSAALDLGMILFVVGEVMMFGSSTLYHWFKDPEKKRMMIPVEETVYNRYKQFLEVMTKLVKPGKTIGQVAEEMRGEWGNAYWYYYFFGRQYSNRADRKENEVAS